MIMFLVVFLVGIVVGARCAGAFREAWERRLRMKGPSLQGVQRIERSLYFRFEGVEYVSDLSWLGPDNNEDTACSYTYRVDGKGPIDYDVYIRFRAAYQAVRIRERDTKALLREIVE